MPDLSPIGNFRLTDHALFEMERRQVDEGLVATERCTNLGLQMKSSQKRISYAYLLISTEIPQKL